MNKAVSESVCELVARHHRIPEKLCTLMPGQVETPEQADRVAAALHAIHDHAVYADDVGVKRQVLIWNLQLVAIMVGFGWADAEIDAQALQLRRLSVNTLHVRLDTASALRACFQ